MATKPDLKLGQKITEPQERDAIHVAVIPVRIYQYYNGKGQVTPGTHVGFLHDDYVSVNSPKLVGIIDPFLDPSKELHHGDRVWLFVYPNTITSLRHDWEHPDITLKKRESLLVDRAIATLKDIAEQVEMSLPQLVELLSNYLDTGEWHTLNFDTPDIDAEAMWDAFEVVTGRRGAQHKDNPFSCAC